MINKRQTRSIARVVAEVVLVPIALLVIVDGGWVAMAAAITWALYEYVDGLRVGRLQSSTDDN